MRGKFKSHLQSRAIKSFTDNAENQGVEHQMGELSLHHHSIIFINSTFHTRDKARNQYLSRYFHMVMVFQHTFDLSFHKPFNIKEDKT